MIIRPIEIVGLFASAMVTLSYVSSKLKIVRLVNILGSVAFIVYGIVLQAHSVWITNTMALIINVYKLYKEGFSIRETLKVAVTKLLRKY